MLKTFVFEPLEDPNKKTLLDCNLDQILLLSFYHVAVMNNLCINLKKILSVYETKISFTYDLKREDLNKVYTKTFKTKLSTEAKNINIILPKKKVNNENPNSTPIHTIKHKDLNIQNLIHSP